MDPTNILKNSFKIIFLLEKQALIEIFQVIGMHIKSIYVLYEYE